MDSVRWQRVKDIFATALEQDATDREAFLDEACASDTELRTEVDSLIAAHENTDDFIEQPAAHRALESRRRNSPTLLDRAVASAITASSMSSAAVA